MLADQRCSAGTVIGDDEVVPLDDCVAAWRSCFVAMWWPTAQPPAAPSTPWPAMCPATPPAAAPARQPLAAAGPVEPTASARIAAAAMNACFIPFAPVRRLAHTAIQRGPKRPLSCREGS